MNKQIRREQDNLTNSHWKGGAMFNTLGRSRSRKEDDAQRAATLGRYDNAPRYYHDDRAPPSQQRPPPRHFEDDPRNRETAFPPRDVYFDKVRSRDEVYDSHSSTSSKGSRRYNTLQPGQAQDFRRFSEQEDAKAQRNTVRESKMNGSSKGISALQSLFDRPTNRPTDSPKPRKKPLSLEPSPEQSDYSWLTTPSPLYHDTHKRRNIVPNTLFYGQNTDDTSSVTNHSNSYKSLENRSERSTADNPDQKPAQSSKKGGYNRHFAYDHDHPNSNSVQNGHVESRGESYRGSDNRNNLDRESGTRSSPRRENQRKKISPVSVKKQPVLMKTISVTDIGSIRIKRLNGEQPKNGREAAQDFLTRKQEQGPRRKSLFGRGGSLFDLFGLNQNNQDSSSSDTSSADTVIETPSPQIQRRTLYKSKSTAHIDSGRISPLTVAPGRTLAEQIRIDKEREEEEERRIEEERRKKGELERKRRDEELIERQKYEMEVEAARAKARERQEREERARGLETAPVVSQRSLLIASKHLEDERRKSRRFSKAEVATARSLLDKLSISKKTDMTETDTVKLKKQKSRNKVPEDLYKAVQQRTPNEHIFVEYGKEIKRVVTPPLPIPLEKLLDKIISTFGDTLTADMVPLKALYIQDAQTKIFYQLDDQNDVVKGSHLKLHEDLVIKNIDRGSSQSLEDLNNSSNSSLSSGGGYVIPPTANPVSLPTKPTKRPGKHRRTSKSIASGVRNRQTDKQTKSLPAESRLSLVEERLSLITHEIHTIHKSDTCSEVSSQTDLPVVMADPKNSLSHLHTIIRTLYQNLKDTKSELMLLKRRELESRAEMDAMVRTTAEEISRHIEAAMPKGIRGERIEADKVEADYRQISEETYANIKDLERTVEVLKSDVVKRKVRLDPVQLESMEKELQSYTEKVSHMNSTFDTLKESLKKVMKEELEIIVNEEQFLEDEEPMLEDATVKCEELERVVETLKKVATMQREKGSNPLSIYTASEYDIMEERHGVMQAIAALVPNHDERIQSIQETEEIRAVQKKFQKSQSDFVTEEIQFKSQNLRKTNAFEELEKKRADALKAMYTAQPPPHRFGRKTSQPQFSTAPERKVSISKCKSMSSIGNNEEDSRHFKYSVTDSDGDASPPPSANQLSSQSAVNIKRSQSFNKDKDKNSSEDEKTKKKTVFGFFSKKSKSNSKHDDSKHKDNNHSTDNHVGSNGDVFVVDTANIKDPSNPPSPAVIPRSYTEGSRKNLPKSRSKTDRTLSVNFDEKLSRHKKGKTRS